MPFDIHKNLAISTVATAPSPATTGTSLVVAAGHGTRFPTVPFNATVWPANTTPDPANAEIVRVTAISTDTLTITREQESTSARTIVVGDQIAATITKKTLDDVERQGLRQSFRGLTLRTHPDADVAASKVWLDHADEIVMHDGESVSDWNDLVADMTASGAGGLDTGSEGASRWYEIYAIRKSSDGAKNLLLHRAKNYGLDASFTTDDTNDNLRVGAADRVKLSQGFQVTVAGPVSFIDVHINKTGSPVGRVWLTIESDSAGNPSGSAVATSDKLDVSVFPTTKGYFRFIFRTTAALSISTQYHIVMQGDWTMSGSDVVAWRGAAAGGYASGSAKKYNGTSWAAAGVGDFNFKVYVTQNDSAVTMPSGYDQRCLIGYVYNDSSSDFRQFWAVDRIAVHRAAVVTSNITATVVTLLDMSSVIPPVPVRGTKWEVSNTVANSDTRFGPTFSGANVPYEPFGVYFMASVNNETKDFDASVPLEFQHMYGSVGSNQGLIGIKGFRW